MILAPNPLTRNGQILVEMAVLDALAPYRQADSNSPEAGGILLGFRRGQHLHVVDFTPPQIGDTHSRIRFDRVSDAHQKIALDRWTTSNSRLDYVGEWHTHPELNPTPSRLDMREWKKIYSVRPAPMLFAILGTRQALWLGVGLGARFSMVRL